MKKILVLGSLLFVSSSYACTFKVSDTESLREVVRQHGGYPISDAQCNFLNQRNLALSVDGKATVLDGVSVAWTLVTLGNLETGIRANRVRMGTKVNTRVASQNTADDLLYEAIRDSIAEFEYEIAANEVKAYMTKNKK